MYKCDCGKHYECSKENSDILPNDHIIECPHCGIKNHVIGADVETEYYGATKDKPVFVMYGRTAKPGEILKIIKGIKR